jgi:hypothetical protein
VQHVAVVIDQEKRGRFHSRQIPVPIGA